MGKTTLEIEGDVSDAIKSLQEMNAELSKSVESVDKIEREFKQSSGSVVESERKAARAISDKNSKLIDQEKQQDMVKRSLSAIGRETKVAMDTRPVSRFSIALRGVGQQMTVLLDRVIPGLGTGLSRAFGLARSGVAGLTGGFRALRIAIAATGIGALILSLGSLFSFFTQTKRGAEELKVVFAAIGATVDVLVDRLSSLGEALFNALSSPENLLDSIRNSFSGITEEIRRETVAARNLQIALNSLKDSERAVSVERSKAAQDIAELRFIAEDRANSEQKRLEAIREAARIEENIVEKEIDNARLRLNIIQQQNALGESSEKDLEKAAQAEIELNNLLTASFNLRKSLASREEGVRREGLAKENANRAARLKLEADFNKALEELAKASQEAFIEGLSSTEQIFFRRDQQDEEINLIEENLKKKIALIELEKEIGIEGIKSLSESQLDERVNSFARTVQLETEQLDQINQLRLANEREFQDKLTQEALNSNNLDERQRIAELNLTLVQQAGESELEFERRKQQELLNIQIEFASKRLELLRDSTTQEDQIQALELEKLIRDLRGQLGDLAGSNIEPGFLNKLLGLNDEEIASLAQSASIISNTLLNQITASTQAQLAQNDAVLDGLNDRINETQSLLDEELDKREQGFANDVEALQARLDSEKQAERVAQEEREALARRQANIQRAAALFQIGANTATAVSGAITQAQSVPFPANLVAIVSGITAVLAGIVQARAALPGAPTFAKGGGLLLQGASHQHGGMDLIDNNTGRKVAEYEGNEYLFAVNKRSTSKYLPLLEDINNDNIPNLRKRFSPSKMVLNPEIASDMSNHLNDINVSNNNFLGKDVEDRFRRMEYHLNAIASKKEANTWTDGNKVYSKVGNTVRVKKLS